jgi:hypothetical protein
MFNLKTLSPKKRLLLLVVALFVVLSVISALVLFVFASRGGNLAGVPISISIASSPTGAPTTGSPTPEVPIASQIKYLHTADSNEIKSYDPETKQVVARQVLPAACKDRAVKDVSLNDGKFDFACEGFQTDTLVFNHGSRVLTEEYEDVLPIVGMDQWVITTEDYSAPYLINKKTGESKSLKAYAPFKNIVGGEDLFKNYYSFKVGDKSYVIVLQFMAPGVVQKIWRIELSDPNYPATQIVLPEYLQIGDTMLAIDGVKVAQSAGSEKGFYATQGNKMQLINYLTGKVEAEYELGRQLLAGVPESDSPLLAAVPGGRYVLLQSSEFGCAEECNKNGLFMFDTQAKKMVFEHLFPNFPGARLLEVGGEYFVYELYYPFIPQPGEDKAKLPSGEVYVVDMKNLSKTQLLTLALGERLVTVEKTN